MTICAVIFDVGGVLLEWSPIALYKKNFPHLTETEIRAFLDEVNFPAWNLEQDKGRPFEQGVAELSARFPHRAALIRAYHEHWLDCIPGPIEGTIQILQELRGNGLKRAALTNFSAEKLALIKPSFSFFAWFDVIVVSAEVQLVKPDPAIYHLTLARLDCPAEACVFIDDALPNIETARRLGFHGIHFRSPQQLRQELHALRLL
ncbi:MAG: 2-haloalkanoic acid dehalogenase [Anaerolineae bacterium]|nr:MAG: 2-haloalkanoic acid dehalogenase [Anaerolineae bacterium]